MKGKITTTEGIDICDIIGLKTIRGIRSRAAKLLEQQGYAGRFCITIENGNDNYKQFIQI